MRFRCEIHQRVETILKYCVHRLFIGDISAYKLISGIFRDIGQTLRITRIREAVEIDDVGIASAVQQMANEVRADKSRTAGDQNFQANSSYGLGRKYLRQLIAEPSSPQPWCASGLDLVPESYSHRCPPRVL